MSEMTLFERLVQQLKESRSVADYYKNRAALVSAFKAVEMERDNYQTLARGLQDADIVKQAEIERIKGELAEAEELLSTFKEIADWSYEKLPSHWRSGCPKSIFSARFDHGRYIARKEQG
jgi:hypothetical protein